MIKQKLDQFLKNKRCTLMGVGPVSKNCVDATIELANEYQIPIFMIASRRQIEAKKFGGGYVHNWSTEAFAEYVQARDKSGNVILARDHGGPWQNNFEKDGKYTLAQAMESAKESYKVDILSGFKVIHLDPSIDIFTTPTVEDVLKRVFELYEFCSQVAREADRDILFEIGTDEQTVGSGSMEQFEYVITETIKFCQQKKFLPPSFIVAQTGTKVMEKQNVGSFDVPFRIVNELPSEILVPKILDICNRHQVMLKEHNADYLSDESLRLHPKLGIHSANIAPEFGVTESKAFLGLLRANSLSHLADRFLKLAYDSKKWDKWMLSPTDATDEDRAIIAGHYVFASNQFAEIRAEANQVLSSKNIDVDDYLRDKVKLCIMRYLKAFRLLRLV